MPNHDSTSLGDVAGRLRRARERARALRRDGPPEVPGDAGDPGEGKRPRTTVEATIGPLGHGRYRRLTWKPGEDHVVREDLGAAAGAERLARRRSLVYLAHHTDTHLCDAQSPARLEGGETFGWVNPGADGGFRPQETCTAQVLDQMVRATNEVIESPVSGAEMAWCIQTGDNTDNRTVAEARWWVDVLDGRPVTPNTGAPGRYEGVQRSGWSGAWHPDDPGRDRFGRAGFPRLPGFLDAAVAPFEPAGLEVPWLAVFGNHDSIYMGTFGPLPGLRIDRLGPMLAGSRNKPRGTFGLVRAIIHATVLGEGQKRWENLARGPGLQRVTADPIERHPLSTADYVRNLLEASDGPGPVGHGFGPEHAETGRTWWSRPEGEHVQVIGLDSCHHHIGDSGSLGPGQAAWLEEELVRHHRRYLDAAGSWVEGDGPDRLIVVASHHNSWTMTNARDDPADPGPRLLGHELLDLLARFPNVILWLNGHAHRHEIIHHRGAEAGLGLWEVNTASCIDFGQQARTVEIFDNGDDTLSILTTVIDHAAPPAVAHRTGSGWTPVELASMSRELAANDDRWIDPLTLRGGREDRNAELLVRRPFVLR